MGVYRLRCTGFGSGQSEVRVGGRIDGFDFRCQRDMLGGWGVEWGVEWSLE